MRSGRLRHQVQLQKPTETRDSKGQPVKTWSTKATVWAGVEPMRTSEALANMQTTGYQQIRVVIRYRDDISMDWRVVMGTRTFEVMGQPLLKDEKVNNGLELMCREII